jgi:Ca2+-binding EF-hand superfamily protein
MSSSANLTKKLDFLFKVYDTDNDGHIFVNEIVKIIEKMTKLCGIFFKLNYF